MTLRIVLKGKELFGWSESDMKFCDCGSQGGKTLDVSLGEHIAKPEK